MGEGNGWRIGRLALAGALALAACGDAKKPKGPADNMFRASPNGFSFENYGNEGVTNMTAEEMRRMFGDQVCGSTAGGCTLTPAAQQFMEEANKSMGGGHCFGFSHLALGFFSGKVKPADFGGDTTFALGKNGNEKLQREIAYWMATQIVQKGFIPDLSPNEMITRLRTSLAGGTSAEQYTLGFFKTEMGRRSGGHAVTPYAIQDVDANTVRLMVYDNNFPNQERAIEVDVAANKWKYTASINPSEPAGLYEGDATTKSILLAPLSGAQGTLACPFCGDSSPAMAMSSPRRIVANGPGAISVEDDAGRKLSDTVNEIPGATVQPVFSGDLFRDRQAPSMTLPGGSALLLSIAGGSDADGDESVSVFGPGYTLAVEDVRLSAGQTDTLYVSPTGDEIRYFTETMETPTLVLGLQTDGADYEFDIRVTGDADGQEAILFLDLANGRLAVQVVDNDGATFEVVVRRIDAAGTSEFVHAGNSIEGSDTLWFDYAAWEGEGSPMTVGLDQGSDGAIEESVALSDDN